jgi:hypothetical protein
LIEPGFETEFVSQVQEYLDLMPEWQVVEWTDLAPNHPLFGLESALQKPGIPCAEIPFVGGFEEFWSRRGKELRRNLRRYRDRAQQLAPIQFEVYRDGTAAAFLKDVAERMSEAGIARFFVLRFGDEVAAIILAFPYKQKIFAYMSAFDPEHAALGLGRTLLYDALQNSYSEYQAWNFLRGDEPYKTEWGARFQPRARLRLERLTECSNPVSAS